MSIYVNVLVILLLIKYSLNHWPNIEQAKIQKIFLVVSSIILALFTGLRDQYTGSDTLGYGLNFIRTTHVSKFSAAMTSDMKNGEYGYRAWTWLISRFTSNPNIFFTFSAVIFAVCLAVYIYKNSQNPFFSMVLYYTVGMFGFQMTGMRQSLAMAILLISFEFIKKRKLIWFLITVYIASLFHNSALAFALAYFVSHLKVNFKTFFIYGIGFLFCAVYGNRFASSIFSNSGYYDHYTIGHDVADTMGGWAVIGMLFLTIILCYIFKNKLITQSKYNTIFFNLAVTSLIIYILRYVTRIFERISFYYQFAFIILLPNVIEAIPDDKTRKIVYTCAIALACALFFYRYQMKGTSYYGFLWKY